MCYIVFIATMVVMLIVDIFRVGNVRSEKGKIGFSEAQIRQVYDNEPHSNQFVELQQQAHTIKTDDVYRHGTE